MRGQDAYDEDKDAPPAPAAPTDACYTETRPWNFADPLHSRPVAFTYGCVGGGPCTTSSDPIIKLFIGTNDGMVRIINNSTGEEEWAFVPDEMLNKQYALSQNDSGDHIYGLDDSPAFLVNDVNNDGVIDPAAGDRVYMYIGMRRGGRNIYAFDVSPTSPKKSSQPERYRHAQTDVGHQGRHRRLRETGSNLVATQGRAHPRTVQSEQRMRRWQSQHE